MISRRDLQELVACTPESFSGVVRRLDPEWLDVAFDHVTGGAEAKFRTRRFPILHVLWLVIGMALFRDRSIPEVADHLELVITPKGGAGSKKKSKSAKKSKLSKSAFTNARSRLGSGPLETLFEISANHWSAPTDEARWNGLSLFAADGFVLSVAATPENDAVYGRAKNGTSLAPFPQIRCVALVNLESRVMRRFSMGGYQDAELSLMEQVWDGVPDNAILLVDSGLHKWAAFYRLTTSGTNRHWMTLARGSTAGRMVERLGRGDEIIELDIPAAFRRRDPTLPETFRARRTTVWRRGHRPRIVLSSLLDPEKFPAAEVRKLYGRRWGVEITYNEVKTRLLEAEDVLRSKTPEGVRQEIFGCAIAYNLVRLELAQVAARTGVDPLRFSFLHSLHFIRNFMLAAWSAAPGRLAERFERLEEELAQLIVPERPGRRYPRQVIRRRAKYNVRPAVGRRSRGPR